MTRCAYIYTSEGVRLPEERVIVLVEIDGKLVRLKLVRPGKGRSRIDRWPGGSGPDGSTGEINTRDLQEWQENGTLSLYNAFYKTQSDEMVIISLDLNNVIGRGGREKSADETLSGISRYAELSGRGMNVPGNWMLDALLRYAPYGTENSDDYREVIDAILPSELSATYQFLTPSNVVDLIKSGATNFLLHCGDDHIEYITSLKGVYEYIQEASDVEPGTKERVDSAVKINETVSYLREGGGGIGYIIGKKSLSVKDLFRVSRRGTWELFEHMAENFPSEVASYIESADVRESMEAAMFLAAMQRTGETSSVESRKMVGSMLYVNPHGYQTHLEMLDELHTFTSPALRYGSSLPYNITKDLLSCVAPVSPVVLHSMVTLPQSRIRHNIQDACRAVAEDILTKSLKRGESNNDHITYALETLLRPGIASGYQSNVSVAHLNPLNLLDRVNSAETDSLMYRALSVTSDEQVMRILSSDEEQRSRSIGFANSDSSSISHRGIVMAAAACCERMPEYFNSYVERRSREDVPNIAAGVVYAQTNPELLEGWFQETIIKGVLDTESPWGRYPSEGTKPDLRASVSAVIARAVMAGGHTDSVSQALQTASDDSSKKSMRSLFKPSNITWQNPELLDLRDPKREARESVRIGVALGTDDVDILTSIMRNDSDYAAGPIAAMRLSGHPDVLPLSKDVPSDVKKQATEKLGNTLSVRGIYFVETAERAVSVTRALFDSMGLFSRHPDLH